MIRRPYSVLLAALAVILLAAQHGLAGDVSGATDPGMGAPADELLSAHGDFLAGMDRVRPLVSGSYVVQPSSSVHEERGIFDLQHLQSSLRLPLPLSRDLLLPLELAYGLRRYNPQYPFRGFAGEDEALHRISLRAGLGGFLTDDLFAVAVVAPGIYSDLDGEIQGDDVRIEATGLVIHRVSPAFYVKGGLHRTDAVGNSKLVPVLGLSWQMSPTWRLDLLFPERGHVTWEASETLRIHLGVTNTSERYHWRAPVTAQKHRFDVQLQEIRAVGGLSLELLPSVRLHLETGAVVAGQYELKATRGPSRLDGDLEPSFVVSVGLGWYH
ncbi:DUF6268 family outer membrane beta-barrel protein [Planctomycetota bacterium]